MTERGTREVGDFAAAWERRHSRPFIAPERPAWAEPWGEPYQRLGDYATNGIGRQELEYVLRSCSSRIGLGRRWRRVAIDDLELAAQETCRNLQVVCDRLEAIGRPELTNDWLKLKLFEDDMTGYDLLATGDPEDLREVVAAVESKAGL